MAKILSVILFVLSAVFASGCNSDSEGIRTSAPSISSSQQTQIIPSEEQTDDKKQSEQPPESEEQDLRGIKISVGGQSFTATLADTKAAEEFAALLPITLNMSELNGNEKYFNLDGSLSTDSRIPDMIHAGDIMLFGSNCVVLFYEDFSTSYSYTPIAHIEDTQGLKFALGSGNVTISFS